MLVLSRAEVEALLDPNELIEELGNAMADLSAGRASMPVRTAAVVPEQDAFLGSMSSFVPTAGVLEAKLVSVFPRNAEIGIPTHQAVISAFDPETGRPVALMDGTYITAVRTAAGSALATRLLARDEAAVMAIVGTGVQARSHARAVSRVRSFQEIRVAGRDPEKARLLADELSAELGLPVEAGSSYAEAIDGADVVCAATHSPEPVVHRQWLSPGAHVNSVGFNMQGPEIDAATFADALVVVESRDVALAPPPSGPVDLHEAIRSGVISPEHVATEIGELVSGTKPGRTSPDQITLYRSVGVAVQDAAAVSLVLRAARERGVGSEVEI
jgi:alanine dehydrogenase